MKKPVFLAMLFCASILSSVQAMDSPPLSFEGFDIATAYPAVQCEVRFRLYDGRWPYRYELLGQTGGVTLDVERGLMAWQPKAEGVIATFEVRVTDADGATQKRQGKITCTRTGFFFVDGKTGSDDNPGTEKRPWKTIGKAAGTLKAGETALVRAGRYSEPEGPLGKNYWSRPTLTPQNSGKPGGPITFRAYPGETVVIADSRIGTSMGRKWITWEGFVLAYGTTVAMFGTEGSVCRGLFIHGHTVASGDNHDGIRIQHATRFVVEDCHIRNMRGWSQNSAGIKIYKDCTGVVQNCYFFGSNANIFDKDSSLGVHYRRNILENGGFRGNNQGLTRNLRIYENLFIRSQVNLHVLTEGIEFHHNTLAHSSLGSTSGRITIKDAHCWNNILWGMNVTFPWKTCDYNVYYHPDPKVFTAGPPFRIYRYSKQEKNFRSLEAWQKDMGWDAHSRLVDPGFVNAAKGDFRLKPDSPALKAGRDGGYVGAFTSDGPLLGIRKPWRDRKPIPEEEAKTAAAAHLLKKKK